MIRLSLSPTAFDDLKRLTDALAQPAPADVRRLDRAIRAEAAFNFKRQGSGAGAWAALSPATVRERLRLAYGPRPILIRRGSLYRSFTHDNDPNHAMELTLRSGGWALAVGSTDARAPWHEFGTRRMPARPVLSFDAAQEGRVFDSLEAMLADIERRTA